MQGKRYRLSTFVPLEDKVVPVVEDDIHCYGPRQKGTVRASYFWIIPCSCRKVMYDTNFQNWLTVPATFLPLALLSSSMYLATAVH